MSDIEIKKGRTKKNGEPDLRSKSSAANVSKARSKVKAFLQAGKQIIDNSESEESGDEIIDLVIRKKDAADSDVIRRTPLKKVLKAKKKRFEQPDSSGSDEDDENAKQEPPQPKISKSKAKIQDMEKNIKN
jgi:hypothetical protein